MNIYRLRRTRRCIILRKITRIDATDLSLGCDKLEHEKGSPSRRLFRSTLLVAHVVRSRTDAPRAMSWSDRAGRTAGWVLTCLRCKRYLLSTAKCADQYYRIITISTSSLTRRAERAPVRRGGTRRIVPGVCSPFLPFVLSCVPTRLPHLHHAPCMRYNRLVWSCVCVAVLSRIRIIGSDGSHARSRRDNAISRRISVATVFAKRRKLPLTSTDGEHCSAFRNYVKIRDKSVMRRVCKIAFTPREKSWEKTFPSSCFFVLLRRMFFVSWKL